MLKYMPLFLLLWSCNTVKPFKITDEYKKVPFEPKKVAIAVDFNSINIDNKDDVEDDLPAFGNKNVDSVYLNFFLKTFDTQFRTKMPEVPYEIIQFGTIQKDLQKVEMRWEKDSKPVNFYIPEEGKILSEVEGADLVLMIQGITIKRRVTYSFNPYGGSSEVYLSQDTKYCLWDNRNGKMISVGEPKSESSVFFAMVKKDWENVVTDAFREITQNPKLFKTVKMKK